MRSRTARLLLAAGASLQDTGRCSKTPLEYTITMDDPVMMAWLISQGCDFERYNPFGHTPLMEAATEGAARCVQCLLDHGANIHKRDRSQFSQQTVAAHAANLEIAALLVLRGADINELGDKVRAELIGIGRKDSIEVSAQDYANQKHRVFGTSNPEVCSRAFWYEIVRCNASAWKARKQFGDDDITTGAVWCYDRFGKSLTVLPDGTFVEIAGEHEDSYDPDFCIYKDIFHHKGDGTLTIYQYPKDVFPCTDFHTATLVGNSIYIIGNLGYPQERLHGTTPVYRLNVESFAIERVATSGLWPCWLFKHSAFLVSPAIIRVQGGEVLELSEDHETGRYNELDFELDLGKLEWTRHDHIERSGSDPCFPEDYKHFAHSDGTLVREQLAAGWRALKILTVHRIDVTAGQMIRIGEELVRASADDFLFVVLYAVGAAYDSPEALRQAAKDGAWRMDDKIEVCRTINFPQACRFVQFEELSMEEKTTLKAWRDEFERGEIHIP